MDCQCFKTANLPNIILILITGYGVLRSTPAQAEDLLTIDYQGRIEMGTTPYSGHGYIKFAIIDDPITPSRNIWTNDGSMVSPGKEPERPIALSFRSGQFSIALGDKRLGNMAALDLSAYNDNEAYLRVWFSVDGTRFEQLSPDNQLPDRQSPSKQLSAKTEPLHARSANAVTGFSVLSTAQIIDNTRNTTGIINAAALATSRIP